MHLEVQAVALAERWNDEKGRGIIKRRFFEIATTHDEWRPTMTWAINHREMIDFRVITNGPEPNTFLYFVHEIHEDRFGVHIIGPTEYTREWFMGTRKCPPVLPSHENRR